MIYRILFLIFCLCTSDMLANKHQNSLEQKLLKRIEHCVSQSSFQCKTDMLDIVSHLQDNHHFLETGSDALRAKCVGLQGIIEHVLACAFAAGEIRQLVGVIHTPAPATPLCASPETNNIQDLLDPTSANDPEKLLSIRSRVQIMRDYLLQGGRLHAVYPAEGFFLRTPEQQANYSQILEEFPHSLFDWPLAIDEIPPERIGAVYLFEDQQGDLFAFSIKSTQAFAPHDNVEWGLWFGEAGEPSVNDRLVDILNYVIDIGGPDILKDIAF